MSSKTNDSKTLNHLEARIAELESKVAFQDDTIDQLSNELSQHQDALAKLQHQLTLLGDRFKQIKDEMDMEQPQTIVHEIPPHY